MKEILNLQYKNAFLWVPFLLAFGGALYFSIGVEPNFHFPILICVLLVAIIYKYKNVLFRIIALFLFGFFYAMSFAHIINTPQIKNSFRFVDIIGTVQNLDFTTESVRVLLSVPKYQKYKNVNFRITINNDKNILNIGDTISAKIKTFHPSAKYIPDSFDFARWAYFNKISGTGFFEDYKIVLPNQHNINLRTYIHNKSNSMLTDALILGYKQTIPEKHAQIWKSVGVGHVWAISGFHMTLVGGWLFALFYLLFRSLPRITKRIPAKYPAMICAWCGLIFYLCISGISVATIRAFLMATLVFAATILGRSVFSLRNGALAFIIIFLINPFFVMNAGFQSSFAAAFGLLWFFNNREYKKRNILNKILHFVYLSFMTALIATLFTLPFIVAHFGYIPIYSLIGNIIILPIFSFLIMPFIMVGTILALCGYHCLIDFTNHIYNYALSVATYISNLPYANLQMPPVSNPALIFCIIGFLFLILIVKNDSKNIIIKNINYILCMCCMTIAIVIYSNHDKPLFYATNDHQLVGFVVDGKIKFNKEHNSQNYFAFNTWRELNGENPSDKNEKYKCDKGLCIYKTNKWKLVYMQHFVSVMNNIENVCRDKSVDFIVSPFEINAPKCHGKILKDGLLIYPNGHIKKVVNRRLWHNHH